MPIFDTLPPDQDGTSGFRLIRTPPAHALIGYVLSDNLTGCPTHFVNNRTIPCEPHDCEPCASGVPWRWHGYLAVLVDATQEVALFECTARAATAFAQYFQRYGTTRGCHFKAQRLNARTNGRVLIQCKPADLAKVNLPRTPDVHKLLCHIWGISEQLAIESSTPTRPPFANVQIDRTKSELRPNQVGPPADAQPRRFTLDTNAPHGNGETRRPDGTRPPPTKA